MRKIAVVVAMVLASGAEAQTGSLRGQWDIRAPSIPDYLGTVLIDAEDRATWTAPNDRGREARYFGYIARRDGAKVEMLFTNRSRVTRAHCVRQSAGVLNCYNVYQDGTPSDGYMLVWVGDGPRSLMPASR